MQIQTIGDCAVSLTRQDGCDKEFRDVELNGRIGFNWNEEVKEE